MERQDEGRKIFPVAPPSSLSTPVISAKAGIQIEWKTIDFRADCCYCFLNIAMKKQKIKRRTIQHSLKGSLVKGFLEKKDRKGFELLLPRYKEAIGSSSGIYALYKGDKLHYVGIAQNLLSRVDWHTHDRHKNRWDKVSFFVIDKHRFSKDIETVILRIIEPQGNRTRGKFERHYELQDKLNKIRREIKDLVKRI